MPVEIIGQTETPGKWITAEWELAIKHVKRVCGESPPEMGLEVFPTRNRTQWANQLVGRNLYLCLISRRIERGGLHAVVN